VRLDIFNISDGTPLQIRSLTNGSIYGDMTAIVIAGTTTTTKFYGPDVSWDKFIQLQAQWVVCLLQDVHFFLEDGYSNVLAVSDGSVKFHDMSFGWVLATPTGKRLAPAAGPCNGRGNSLRTEGAGMLSVTMFIALIKHYLKKEKMKILFISDNSELIRRLTGFVL
jgi:hypothetical protein